MKSRGTAGTAVPVLAEEVAWGSHHLHGALFLGQSSATPGGDSSQQKVLVRDGFAAFFFSSQITWNSLIFSQIGELSPASRYL